MVDERFFCGSKSKDNAAREREEVCAALQCAASFRCLEEWKDCEKLKPKPKEKLTLVDEKKEGTKHRTDWCAETNKYRCMRCGRGSEYMSMQGNVQGQNTCQHFLKNRESDILEATIWSENWTGRVKF